jgi:hypothetical protein
MDIPAIAHEIAASIMAGCAPGAISSHALMLDRFVSAYERFGLSPSEGQHQDIADRVGALIRVGD